MLAALALGLRFYLSGGRYISTDNAYVGAHKVLITPDISGKVISVLVREGQQRRRHERRARNAPCRTCQGSGISRGGGRDEQCDCAERECGRGERDEQKHARPPAVSLQKGAFRRRRGRAWDRRKLEHRFSHSVHPRLELAAFAPPPRAGCP